MIPNIGGVLLDRQLALLLLSLAFLVCHSRTSEYSTSDQKSELEQVATLLGPASEATKMQYVLADLKRYDTLAAWDPSQTKLLDTNMFAQTLVILEWEFLFDLCSVVTLLEMSPFWLSLDLLAWGFVHLKGPRIWNPHIKSVLTC